MRKARLKWLWWSSGAFVLFAFLAVGFTRHVQFDVGSHTVQFISRPIQARGEERLFFHSSWDGPTGEFSGGRTYGFRTWKYFGVAIIYDPMAAAKRRLPTSVDGLMVAMDSKDFFRRVCAFHRLAELRADAAPAIPALVKRLARDDPDAQETLTAISRAVPATALPFLTNALLTGNVTSRWHILEVLTEIGPQVSGAVPSLTGCLRDPEEKIVLQSAYAMSKIGGQPAEAVAALRRVLSSPEPQWRAGALAVLNEFGDDARSEMPEIIRLLDDPNVDVHAMAARTLAGVRRAGKQDAADIPINSLPRLESLARGSDIAAQWAIDALSTMGTNGARILSNLNDRVEPGLRYQITEALIRLGPQAAAALPMLMAELSPSDARRAQQAARIIASMGVSATSALPALTLLLEDENALVRVQAAGAIWKIDRRTEVVLPVLLSEIKEESPARRIAAELLGEMGPAAKEAVPLLHLLLRDPRSDVPKAAAGALQKIE